MLVYFQAFAQLLQAPQGDAQVIIQERFPVPRLVVCDQHGSQVRIFLQFSIWVALLKLVDNIVQDLSLYVVIVD